jgi:hypothetical protein
LTREEDLDSEEKSRARLAPTPSELPWRNWLKPKRGILKMKFFIKYTVIIH